MFILFTNDNFKIIFVLLIKVIIFDIQIAIIAIRVLKAYLKNFFKILLIKMLEIEPRLGLSS